MSEQIKSINVTDVTLKTATVEVKSLTLNNKQVTLAVFRQLKEETLIDAETCELRGTPWGVVNYHPDRCADEPPHLHVVWQKGAELRRALVPQTLSIGSVRQDKYEDARAIALLSLFVVRKAGNPNVELQTHPAGKIRFTILEKTFCYDENEIVQGRLFKVSVAAALINDWNFRKEFELLEKLMETTPTPFTAEDIAALAISLLQEYEEEKRFVENLRNTYKNLYTDLKALPQLFIAV